MSRTKNTRIQRVKICPPVVDDEEIDSLAEAPIDNFGVSFIFERALRRLDVHAEQRKLQQDKFESHLKKYESDNEVLELKLTNKCADFNKLNEKYKTLRTQLVEIKTEKDMLEMKLQHIQESAHRLERDAENLRWTKNELMDMINRSRDIVELRKKILSRRLY